MWNTISEEFKNKQLPADTSEMVRDAFLTLWNVVVKGSILIELPKEREGTKESAIVDLDLEEDEQEIVSCPPSLNAAIQRFRE